MVTRGVILLLAALTAVTACADAPRPSPPARASQPSPSPASPGPTVTAGPSFDPQEIAEWTAFRRRFGLRNDLGWILEVAQHPDAVRDLPAPLLPDELERFVARTNAGLGGYLQAVAYGAPFDEWAGAFLDGPTVVVQFSDNVAQHRAALELILGSTAPLDVRQVEWSLEELEGFQKQLEEDHDWMSRLGVEYFAANLAESENTVELLYNGPNDGSPGPDPDTEGAIRAHLGDPSWLGFRWNRSIEWTGPRGDLVVRVRAASGGTGDLWCDVNPDDPAADEGDTTTEVEDGRCTFERWPAGRYVLSITRGMHGPVIGTKEVTIAPNTLTRSSVRVP
jgi:hypothetical protein